MGMQNKEKLFYLGLPTYTKTNIDKRIDNVPTDEELLQIQSYYKGATKENVKVFEMGFGNTINDRVNDIFSEKSIDVMVKTAIGKPVLEDHDHTKCIGKVFDTYAKVVDYVCEDGTIIPNVKTAFAKFYVLNTEKYQNIIADMEGGIKEFTSPGFSIKGARCSICNKEYSKCRDHFKGEMYDGVLCSAILEVKEVAEISIVYLGCQYGTQIEKSYGGEEMELKELQAKYDSLEKDFNEYKEKYSESSVNELNTKINDLTAEKNALSELVKVFGEDVSVADLETVKENAEIGKEAREISIKEIKRLKALVDTAKGFPTMEKTLNKFLEGADYAELKEYEKSLTAEANELVPTGRQTETPVVEVKSNNKKLWK